MEKYLADRSYALIYRMCQVQAFSSRLHARGFPAIGKYGPKTPPRTAGAGLADAPLSPRPHFRFCRPRVRYASGRIRRPEGLRLSPSLFSLVFRQHSRNMQVAEAFCLPGSEIERCGPEDRCVRMPNRPGIPAPVRSGSRPAPEPPSRRSPAEASYSVRTDTAIICFVMWRAYPPRSCDISQPRLEAHRPCLRPFPAARSLPTEGSSRAQAGSIGNAKAGTSGHMIRDGDGLRVVSGISVRFPFSARRGRPLRAA